jgi:hypothetical protein
MTLGKIAAAFTCVLTTFGAITDREEWDKRFYNFTGPFLIGTGGAPAPIVGYRDGEFLIGGAFTNLADTPLLNLARWDGTTWTKPFATVSSADEHAGEIHIAFTSAADGIHSIATHQSTPQGDVEVLVSGAGITKAGGVPVANVAWWTGTQWNDMAGGTTGLVSNVLFDQAGGKIVGGNFTVIGGINARNIARFGDTGWAPIGDGLPFVPDAMTIHEGQLYAAGLVSTAAGNEALILRWSGTEWSPVGSALNGPATPRIDSFLSRPEGLYAGGRFTNVASVPTIHIALWTGTEWQPVGDGLRSQTTSLAFHQGNVIAVGPFLPGHAQLGIARWDSTNWNYNTSTPLRAGKTVAASGEKILVRGQVNAGLDDVLNGAAYFNGESWKPLGQGVNPGVIVVENNRRRVHFVSDEHGVSLGFTHSPYRQGMVRHWNGKVWSPVGELLRFPASVDSLALQGDEYWVGTISGGWIIPPVSSIALTGETNWAATGGGFLANAVVVAGAKVYAGASSGNSGLHAWNGVQFSKVTSYTNAVLSLTTDGQDIYVAGRAGGSRWTISRFDGISWTELGVLTNAIPRFEVQFVNGSLYAYGSFTSISGVPINRVGRWDGQQWHSVLPDSIALNIYALAGDGRDSIYVGGFRPGSRTNLYQIRGSTVVPVDAPAAVEALHWWRGALYAAGDFTSMQSVPSGGIAAWHDPEAAVEVIVSAPASAVQGTEAELILHVANLRTNSLNNVELRMPLPSGVTPVNLSPNMSIQGTNIVWQLATLESGVINLNARLRLEGTPGSNLTFEVWASGPGIPTFRSTRAATTLLAVPEFRLVLLGENPDGSWRLSWSGASTNWGIQKSHDLTAWQTQPFEVRDGQATNEFTIPASTENHVFWRMLPGTSVP